MRECACRGGRETYGSIVSAELLARLDPTEGVDGWRDLIDSGVNFSMLEVDGVVRGFATSGRPDPRDEPPRDLELWLIYQEAGMHGSGSGQALLDSVVGSAPAFLWAAELNPRAQRFYRRNGFELDGARKTAGPEWEHLAEVRMVR